MLNYKYFKERSAIEKDTIILLHGIGGNSNIFYKQIDEYKRHFNVLAIDLPGHGDSPDINDYAEKFSFNLVVNEIEKTMNILSIQKAHFVGISLGSIIIHHILQSVPERVESAVLGGTITGFNLFSKGLMVLGKTIKKITPHMWIYSLFAHIMMPKKNHEKSRGIFIKEAKKMNRNNFLSWFDLIVSAEKTYKNVQAKSIDVPKLYISGKEDHLFVKILQMDIRGDKSSQLLILDYCGHVCNIEKPIEFNTASLNFITKNSSFNLTTKVL